MLLLLLLLILTKNYNTMTKFEKLKLVNDEINNYYDINNELNKSNHYENCIIRQFKYYLLRYEFEFTYNEIGNLCNKNYSTVIRGIKSLTNKLTNDIILNKELNIIQKSIRVKIEKLI